MNLLLIYLAIGFITLLVLPFFETYDDTKIHSMFGLALLWPILFLIAGIFVIPAFLYRKYWEFVENLKIKKYKNKINLTKPSIKERLRPQTDDSGNR